MNHPSLTRAFDFCQAIGLAIEWQPGANGFVPGVRIEQGVLHVDPTARAGDLLHEAAHLAIMPPSFRSNANTNLHHVFRVMLDSLDAQEPESPLNVAIMQCGDTEATAWGWAAGLACGVPDEEIIGDASYDGSGADIRLMLQLKSHLGINGLARGGMTRVRGHKAFPAMQKWLQDAI